MLFLLIPAALSALFFFIILGHAFFPHTHRHVVLDGGRFRWPDLCRRLRKRLEEGKILKVLSPPLIEGDFAALGPEDRWVGYHVLEVMGDPLAVDEAMGDLFSDAPWLQARSAQYLARLGEAGAFLPLTQSAERGTLLSQAYVNDALLRLPEPPLSVLLELARTGRPHLIRIAILELPRFRPEEREALLGDILAHLRGEHAAVFLRYVEQEGEKAVLESLFFRLESLPGEIQEPFIELFFLRHPVDPYADFLEGRLATLTGEARLSVAGLLGRAYGARGPAEALRFMAALKSEAERLRFMHDYRPPAGVCLQTVGGLLPTLTAAMADVVVTKLKAIPTEASLDLLLKALESCRWAGDAVVKGIAAMEAYPRPLAMKGCFALLSAMENPAFQDMVRNTITKLERA
jgi:hypothetical protein